MDWWKRSCGCAGLNRLPRPNNEIDIAGPSSSGKTELARQLVQRLPGTSVVSLDSYYRGMEEIPLAEPASSSSWKASSSSTGPSCAGRSIPKVYVETDAAVCFERRLRRDVAERGRSPEFVREQYERTVRPSAEWFVFPTKKFADLVVSGEEPLAKSTDTVVQALRRTVYWAGA